MECLLFQPHPHKEKIPAECWRAKKIICKRILEKKNSIVNQGVEKKFHDQTKSPTPPPQKSNGRPLKLRIKTNWTNTWLPEQSDEKSERTAARTVCLTKFTAKEHNKRSKHHYQMWFLVPSKSTRFSNIEVPTSWIDRCCLQTCSF